MRTALLAQEARAVVERTLRLLPEVRWGRWTGELGSINGIAVYGWVSRPDGKSDFVLVRINCDGPWHMSTSSAQYSEQFARRLSGGSFLGHQPCKPVEGVFDVTTVRTKEAA
jgi:hypothetical protein